MYQSSTIFSLLPSKDICMLRDILRDQLVLNLEKIRDTTSMSFTMSLIKRTECNKVLLIKGLFPWTLAWTWPCRMGIRPSPRPGRWGCSSRRRCRTGWTRRSPACARPSGSCRTPGKKKLHDEQACKIRTCWGGCPSCLCTDQSCSGPTKWTI